jgi:anti-sigma regulatory factor (Ser/Thr protein kinase)
MTGSAGHPARFKKNLSADMGRMGDLFAFIAESLAESGVSEKISQVVEMAADEIFSNIAKYAYEDDRTRDSADAVTVELSVTGGALCLTFSDCGVPFDPLSAVPPDVTSGGGERELGGLGIYLARSMMDDMRYSREGGRNRLSLVKKIPGSGEAGKAGKAGKNAR